MQISFVVLNWVFSDSAVLRHNINMIESCNKHLTHFNFISEKEAFVIRIFFTQICVDGAFATLDSDFVIPNPPKRKIIYGMRPVERKDRSIDLNMCICTVCWNISFL